MNQITEPELDLLIKLFENYITALIQNTNSPHVEDSINLSSDRNALRKMLVQLMESES